MEESNASEHTKILVMTLHSVQEEMRIEVLEVR